MASPQKENGYTAISNELFEQIVKTALLGAEYQVLFVIIRKTYGYQKKEDIISLSQIQDCTGLSRPTVVKTIKNLVKRKMVVKTVLPHNKISFSINKNYDSWVVKTAKLVKHKDKSGLDRLTTTSKHRLTKTSKDRLTHKRKKEILKKTKEIASSDAPLISEVIKQFETIDPKNKDYYGNTTQRKASEFLIREYGFETVSKAIALLPQTNERTYYPTITTPHQLKDNWVKLKNALLKEKNKLQSKKIEII